MIASKLIETKHPRAADVSFLTNNACTITDICNMELRIVNTLKFNLQLVTSFQYTERFVKACHLRFHNEKKQNRRNLLDKANYSFVVNPKLESMFMYFLDMSLLIPELVDTKKSLVAASALYIARGVIGLRDSCVLDESFWSDALTYYTGYRADELGMVILSLFYLHLYPPVFF